MIPTTFNPMGGGALLDANTRFLLLGSLTDRAFGTAITNHGLGSDGTYIYAPSTTSYAEIAANALASDVLTTSHDWSIEIAFYLPEGWDEVVDNTRCLFGSGVPAQTSGRFDILVWPRSSTIGQNVISIGGTSNNMGTCQYGDNYFMFSRAKSGTMNWSINGAKTGTTVGSVFNARSNPLFVGFSGTNQRYIHPLKIKYIRISNCLR